MRGCSDSFRGYVKGKVTDWEMPAPITQGNGGKRCKLVSSGALLRGLGSLESFQIE